MAFVVLRADAASDSSILTQRVTHTETHHCILVAGPLWQVGEIFADNHEGVAVVEVVAVDDAERLLDDVLTHEYGVVCTPRLLTAFGYGEAFGQGVESLEAKFTLHLALVFREDLCAELLLEILADDPYDLAESGLDGVVDTVVHDGLAVGAQTVELLKAAVTAAHACCKQK